MALEQTDVLTKEDGLIEVYPIYDFNKLPWRRSKKNPKRKRPPRPPGPLIKKTFASAACQFANWLARGPKKTKNRALADELCRRIQNCEYRVYSRVNPEFPSALRPKNLIFELCEGDDSFYDEARTGQTIRVPSPTKKFLLPYRTIAEGGVQAVEHFIPDRVSRFRIALPLRGNTFKGESRKPRTFVKAFNLSPIPRRHVLGAVRAVEGTDDEEIGIVGIVRNLAHPNRRATNAREQARRSRGDRPHLSLVDG